MESKEFSRQLAELRSVITNGIVYFSAWRGLMVEDKDSAHALNRYRGLFLPARNALLCMTLMQFAKVFDRDPRTVSLRNLLTAAKKDREHLTPYTTEENLLRIGQQVDASEVKSMYNSLTSSPCLLLYIKECVMEGYLIKT